MKGKDAARHRIGVGVVAKQRFRARSHIFEPDLTFLANEVLRHIRNVARRLLGESGKRGALRFGLDHAAGLPTYEQAIVHWTGSGLELAHGHAQPGAKVHFSLGLDQPPTGEKPPIDQRAGFVLGVEGEIVHIAIYAGHVAATQIRRSSLER